MGANISSHAANLQRCALITLTVNLTRFTDTVVVCFCFLSFEKFMTL